MRTYLRSDVKRRKASVRRKGRSGEREKQKSSARMIHKAICWTDPEILLPIAMPKKTTPRDDAAAQSARFIEAARELGCDESPDAFEAAVKKVARQKPVEKKSVNLVQDKRK